MGFWERLFGGSKKAVAVHGQEEIALLQVAHKELSDASNELREQVVGQDSLDKSVVPMEKLLINGHFFRRAAEKLTKTQVHIGVCSTKENVNELQQELQKLRHSFNGAIKQLRDNEKLGATFTASVAAARGEALEYYRKEIDNLLDQFKTSELLDQVEAHSAGLEAMIKRLRVHFGHESGVELPASLIKREAA